MSKKYYPFLFSELLYKNGLVLLTVKKIVLRVSELLSKKFARLYSTVASEREESVLRNWTQILNRPA